MKMRKITKFILIITVLTLLMLPGAWAQNNQKVEIGGPKFGGTLRIGKVRRPRNLDCRWSAWGEASHLFMCEPAFIHKPTGGPWNIVPAGWVKSYTFSEDKKTLTLHIKKGITYHDGIPLDAEAVAWGYKKRIIEPELYTILWVEHPEHPEKDIKVLDKYTVQINLKYAAPDFLQQLACCACWARAAATPKGRERYGEDYGSEMAYGNGPFKVKEWVKGDHLTYVRNNDYWWAPSFAKHQGPPYLKEVTIEFIPEATTRVQMLKAGELDMLYDVPPVSYQELKENPDIKVQSALTGNDYELIFNVTNPPVDEIKVRKALSYGVKREPIIEVAFEGLAEPQHTLYTIKAYRRDTTHKVSYDPEKAKKLLEEAGWVDTDEDGVRDKDGKPLKVKLWSLTTPRDKLATQIIQQIWQEIGVKADITLYEEGTLTDKTEAGDHEALLYGHQLVSLADQRWILNPSSTHGYPHFSFSDTPKLRELINATWVATTREGLEKAMDNVINYVTDQAYRCPIARIKKTIAYNKDLQNVQIVGESYWSWLPYMHDVYWKSIYEENLKEQE